MKTLITLKILKLSPNSEILTPQFSICAFCSFEMKFQFIVEAGRGKDEMPHTQMCSFVTDAVTGLAGGAMWALCVMGHEEPSASVQ